MDASKITRVEVIDQNGKAYGQTDIGYVYLVLQDDDRTLKVVISDCPFELNK